MFQRIIGLLLIGLIIWSCNSNYNQEKAEITEVQADSLQRVECDNILKELRKLEVDTFGEVNHIPSDFEGCLRQLDSLTSNQMKEWIKCLPDKEFSKSVHHGFGMYLRNNWGLWRGNSKLAENLYEMGILHPDDMTGIILNSYQRRLKGEDIRLKEQLKYYQDYWRKDGVPVDSILQAINNEDTIDYEYATYFIIVVDTNNNYYHLHKKMIDLNKIFNIPIDTMDRSFNKVKNLIALSDNHEDEIYAGDYFPRRFPSENLSLEYLSFYQRQSGEKTIALVAGIYESEISADSSLSFLQKTEKRVFKIKTDMYVGCVH